MAGSKTTRVRVCAAQMISEKDNIERNITKAHRDVRPDHFTGRITTHCSGRNLSCRTDRYSSCGRNRYWHLFRYSGVVDVRYLVNRPALHVSQPLAGSSDSGGTVLGSKSSQIYLRAYTQRG